MRPRAVILATAAAALALPVSASSMVDFPVSTSLAGCSGEACSIGIEFGPVSGAESYSAVVHTPDGGSVAAGELAPGSSAISVPYVGNGTYTVAVTAWDQGAARAGGTHPTR